MMKLLSCLFILTLVSLSVASEQSGANKQQQLSVNLDRQGRSIASASSSGNGNNLSNSNSIEHSSSKSRIDMEKKQVAEFLTAKNIFKSIVKLLFGTSDEINATSRNVLGVLGKVLDVLKSSFGQRSRSGTARTLRDSAEDAANAGVSMLQGYVRSVLSNDDKCVQRYLCQASKEATRDSRDLGYIIASVGGYASSYLLDNSKSANFKSLYEASLKGRQVNEDCSQIYKECSE